MNSSRRNAASSYEMKVDATHRPIRVASASNGRVRDASPSSTTAPPSKPYDLIWPIRAAAFSRGSATARVASATAAPARSTASRRTIPIAFSLHLDVDDPLDEKRSGRGHDGGQHEQHMTRRRMEERIEVVLVDRDDDQQQRDRQERDDPASDPPLRSQRLDDAAKGEPLSDGVRH